MGLPIVTVNYVAVLVAAIASMVIGMLWYGPVFGKQWMKLVEFTPQSKKRMGLGSASKSMTLGFIAALVTAYVLAHFVAYVGAATAGAGVQLALWLWLGIAAPLQLGAYLWEGKSFKLFVLNAAHTLVSLGVMAAILAVWA
jgi:hypothetical protein